MRALTPSQPQRRSSGSPSSLRPEFDSPSMTPPTNTPGPIDDDGTAPQVHQPWPELDTATTLPDLHAENTNLKEEVARVRAERQVILDHCIKSDQRLLQFSENVFLSPLSTIVNDQAKPHDSNIAYSDELFKVKQELEKAHERITTLEGVIASHKGLCHRCEIQAEETKNMIASIRCLEKEIESMKHHTNTQLTDSSVPSSNRFSVLADPVDNGDSYNDPGFITVTRRTKNSKNRKKRIQQNKVGPFKRKGEEYKYQLTVPFRNLTIVGDSHVRHLTTLMRPMVHPSTTMSGMCKPGAGLLNIAPTSPSPSDNCYIMMAGNNDVANKKEEVIFSHLEDVMKRCLQSSCILLVPLTPRYDLPANSSIHHTVHLVNQYMSELCRRYDGVSMLDIRGIGRNHYTSHGLHLRASGKRLLARIMVEKLALLKSRCHPTTPSVMTPTHSILQGYDSYAAATIGQPPSAPQALTTVSTTLSPDNTSERDQQLNLKSKNPCFLRPPPYSNGLN